MQKIVVELGARSYPIYIGKGLLGDYPGWLTKVKSGSHLCLVTNPRIFELYGERLSSQMRTDGYSVTVVTVPEGEACKSLEQAALLYTALSQSGADRATMMLSLGGGVIGDLCGFVAATYLRGLPLVHLPTTLLSQVDSSIGGKTAVNHGVLKNQIGVIYQPRAVICDLDTLVTLPPREIACGLAEIIKCAIIRDASLFSYIEGDVLGLKAAEPVITGTAAAKAAAIKALYVAADENDRGVRGQLNLGHTVGHALESVSNFELSHGEAVSLGMVAAAKISARMGHMPQGEIMRIIELLAAVGLPVVIPPCDTTQVIEAIRHDKKVSDGKLRFILPLRIGKVVISNQVSLETITEVLAEE